VQKRSISGHEIVIHGSTHQQEMKTRGDTLILNPGEGCGWLYGTPSAAILDLDTKQVEFITLATQEWKY
jgi:predicted phosphodiesterase